ncbi:MAG: DMT family transporter [Rhodobiaceae bacterium]|nr:DMT family transporter [Rhodobiaceae bacterium]MCC0040947.1 DMT family transporter [Rhodobiaceae bacterium]
MAQRQSPAHADHDSDRPVLAFFCVVAGAIAMGISPIFVRLADVGPFASAFWRVALALPALWAWAAWDMRRQRSRARLDDAGRRRAWKLVATAGLLFAGDLFFWHLAIVNTTVANATFLASLAPIAVVFGSWTLLREPITGRILAGLALGLLGAAFLLGSSYRFAPAHLTGDVFGLITALFFGSYFLAVRPARRLLPAGVVIFRSSLFTAAALLVVALVMEDAILPSSLHGIVMLLSLALVSHAGGQGLLAYALGHLPAAFSSIVILIEGVAAALFGWLILAEHLTILQLTGSLAIFSGIYIARPRRAKALPQSPATVPDVSAHP